MGNCVSVLLRDPQKYPNISHSGDKLCRKCSKLDLDAIFSAKDRKMSEDFDMKLLMTVQSTARHCPFCRLLFRAVLQLAGPEHRRFRQFRDVIVPRNIADDRRRQYVSYYMVREPSENAEDGEAMMEVFMRPSPFAEDCYKDDEEADGVADPKETFRIHRINDSQSNELSAPRGNIVPKTHIDLSLTRQWLHKCERKHRRKCECQSFEKVMERPARLRVIDVVNQCVVTAPQDCRYIALSYVWGGAEVVKLMHSTMDTLTSPGGLTRVVPALPQTISDAMHVVDNMGERYLWVDALCIMQETDEELDQISRMDRVYGSALLTIIAADGTHANAGLTGIREGTRSLYQVKETVAPGIELAISLPSPDSIGDSPWSSRGWCLQERLLSKRFIVFTGGQMFWQCNCSLWCEDMAGPNKPDGFKEVPRIKLEPRLLESGIDGSIERRRDGSVHVVRSATFREYAWVVREFSKRRLSYEGDVLRAFFGMIRIFEAFARSEILCGLPQNLFDVALLWQPRTGPVRRRRDSKGEFPSWSWAGWIGEVGYEKPKKKTDEERVRPLLRWSYTALDGRQRLLNAHGYGIREAADSNRDLPATWECTSDRRQDGDSAFPLQSLPHTLYFWTESAWIDFEVGNTTPQNTNINLRVFCLDHDGQRTGTITITNRDTPLDSITARNYSCLKLSEAQHFGEKSMDKEKRQIQEDENTYLLYNILLVHFDVKTGVGLRVGLGRIYKDAWQKARPKRRSVALR